MQNKTNILISHRISGLKNADLILYLKEGKIVESGTHQKLMELKGNYFELNNLQNN